jgi:hypothetical protein
MAGGYKHQPSGTEAVAAEFRRLQREIDDLRRQLANSFTPQPAPVDLTVAALIASLQAAGILITP